MKGKKFMSIVGALTLTLGMVASLPASASCSKTEWIAGRSYTRDKEDASSVYVQNVSDYNYAYVTIYGKISGDNNNYEVNEYAGQTLNTHDVTIPPRSQRRVKQFVYEKGYRLVKVVFTGSGSSGWWSPDCNGTYTYAN